MSDLVDIAAADPMEAPVKVATLSRDRQLALGNLLATLGAMGGTPPLNEFKQALATATAVFAVDEATGARLARAVQLANRHSNGKLLPGSGFDHGSAVEPMGRGRRLAVETGADGIGSVDRADHGANVQAGAFPGFHCDPAALVWFVSAVGSFDDESFDSGVPVLYLGLEGLRPVHAIE